MKLLRWIARDKLLYGMISAIILLLISILVGWQINQKLIMDRELPLSLALGKLVSTIEGGTINSQAMGAAILFGLENQTSKQLLQGTDQQETIANIQQEMNTLRWQFLAKSAILLNQQGKVVAYAADDKQLTIGSQLSSWHAVQMALHGTANIYPSKKDRVIYLAAPVRESNHNKSKAIGVLLIGIDGQKLDVVFDAWTEGIAALISPNGEVFSASRHDWIKTQPDASSLSNELKDIQIDGVLYNKHYMPLEWNDPDGEWRLLVLTLDIPWWQSNMVLGFTGFISLSISLLLWTVFTLVRHEEELLNNELLLKEAQHIAAMGSYVLDIASSHIKISDETYTLFGLDKRFIPTVKSWLTLVHPDDKSMLIQHLEQDVLQHGLAFNKEYRIIRLNDQAERWMHGMGKLETDKQGRYIRLHGTVQDITEKKNIEIKLRQEHEQSQHYLDTTLAIMVRLDEQGNITMLNRTACSILGYQEQELLGRNWFETCLPQPYGQEIVYPVFLQIMAGNRRSAGEFENTILCRDGSLRLVAWRNTVHVNAQGKITGTLSSGIDVTESRKLSQQLTTILEKSPTGIAVFKATGACVMANTAYVNLLGAQNQEQVLQQNFREKASWQQYGLLALAEQALATEETVREDIEGITSFGKHLAVECIFSAVDLSGEQHLMLLINDVSARMAAERALNESLIKLEEKELSKTRFLAAAGHDLRQPIAAANLFVNSLKYSHPSAQQYALIRRLEQSMNVFSSLLECLLDISKLDAGLIQPHMESVPLNEIFGWLDHIFSEVAYHKKLRFLFFFPKNHEIFIQTDRELLKTILMNLVSNAIKFTTHGGILVSARVRADKVLLQVWDTGIGIPQANLPHIFEEFYQVSNPQRNRESGLGLGLASCQRRMALLGGKVTCQSRPNKGSVFSLSLPLNHDKENAHHEIYSTPNKPLGNFITGKKIVVLEDDKLLSDATATLLQTMGAQVRLFSTAEQALQESNILDTDYFIVDYGLGGKLSGLDFLQQLQQQSILKINAVLVTGETSSSFLSRTANCPWPVLYKPIDINKLAIHMAQ